MTAVLTLTNSRGRVVFSANHLPQDGMYDYTYDNGMGFGFELDMFRSAYYTALDNPSARASGPLAERWVEVTKHTRKVSA